MAGKPHRTSGVCGRRGASSRLKLLLLGALAVTLVTAAAAPVLALSRHTAAAGRLHGDLVRIAKLANQGVRPPTLRLAQELPDQVTELGALGGPASTAQDQAGVALDELRQMSAPTTLDPHYLPALVAAGRTFVAASGQDPLTRTTINPDYLGLEAELAASEDRLERAADTAAELSVRVKRLARALAHAKRRAQRLEGRLRRARAGPNERPANGAR